MTQTNPGRKTLGILAAMIFGAGSSAAQLTDSCVANPPQIGNGGSTIVTCTAVYSGTCQGQDTTNFAQIDVGSIGCQQQCPNEQCSVNGRQANYFVFPSPGTCSTSFTVTAPPTGSGTIQFSDSLNTGNSCHATTTLAIPYGTPAQACDEQIRLLFLSLPTARKFSESIVSGDVENLGNQPCTGRFEFDFGVNASNTIEKTTSNRASVTCSGNNLSQACNGSVTLEPLDAVIVSGTIRANQDPIQVPWTLKWDSKTSQGLGVIAASSRAVGSRTPVNPPRNLSTDSKQ